MKKLDTFAGPGEIKRKEVSWTLMKKLYTFAGPGEIKRREVVLDLQVSSEEIMSRALKVGLLFCFKLLLNSGTTDIVTLPRTAVETAIAWYTSCCEIARVLTLPLFWRRSTASSVFWVGARGRAFIPPPTHPPTPRP